MFVFLDYLNGQIRIFRHSFVLVTSHILRQFYIVDSIILQFIKIAIILSIYISLSTYEYFKYVCGLQSVRCSTLRTQDAQRVE